MFEKRASAFWEKSGAPGLSKIEHFKPSSKEKVGINADFFDMFYVDEKPELSTKLWCYSNDR